MSTIVPQLDPNTFVDVTAPYNEVRYETGAFAETGLYTPEFVKQTTIVAKINDSGLGKMTGFNSRRERDADRTAKSQEKFVPLHIPHIKIVEAVTYEDLAEKISGNWIDLKPEEKEMTIGEATVDRQARMSIAMAENHEYLAYFAAQGVLLDPRDGTEKLNMFSALDVTRLTHPLDLTDVNLDLIAWSKALRGKIQRANKTSPTIPTIDIIVDEADMAAIAGHASIQALRSQLITGTGSLAVAQNLLWSTQELTKHGIVDVFDIGGGVRFVTYPKDFVREDGTVVNATAEGSAFTVLRGTSGIYRSVFAPAPYFSTLGKVGSKFYSWRTPIVNDQHFQVGVETSPLYYMAQPELSVDIQITK